MNEARAYLVEFYKTENVDAGQFEISAMRAALAEAEKLGYVLVPKEATSEQIANAAASLGPAIEPWRIYAAMIAARPKL